MSVVTYFGGYVNTTFSGVGYPETFVVPAGITVVYVTMVGGSGGNLFAIDRGLRPTTGRSVQTSFSLSVTPGETLTVQAGKAGMRGASLGAGGSSAISTLGQGGYPDGGNGATMGGNVYSAGGGGSSRVWRGGVGGTLIALMGGGGGLGVSNGVRELASSGVSSFGDAGYGGTAYQFFYQYETTGRNQDLSGNAITNGGHGGWLTPGIGSATNGGSNGTSFQGGNGASFVSGNFTGGGGGGGYIGGGGGGREVNSSSSKMGSQGGGGLSRFGVGVGILSVGSPLEYRYNNYTSDGTDGPGWSVANGFVRIDYLKVGGWSLGLRLL